MISSLIDILINALGPDCISRAPSALLARLTDSSQVIGGMPHVIVFPKTHDDVVALMAIAITHRVPVVPRGAGTGTTGGAVSSEGCIVVDFSRMNRIIEIDEANRVAVVQPGVITQTLQDAVEKVGLFYPPDPASLDTCTLGGNLAENAGGPRAYKYGVTGNYVLGVKGVWGTGDPFNLGGKLFKNVTGYDLISLIVASEGTLALVTEITLKLIPRPTYTLDFSVGFDHIEAAVSVLKGLHQASVYPAVAEWIDEIGLEAAALYLNQAPPAFKICLLFQIDGFSQSDVTDHLNRLEALCLAHGGLSISTNLWMSRRCLSKALRAWATHKVSHDIVVPPAAVGEYLKSLRDLSDQTGFIILGYGHLGDGNVHVNILNREKTLGEWEAAFPELTKRVFKLALALGGTLTGEHGIGLTKLDYLPLAVDAGSLVIMEKIKQVCDPLGLLNRGKGV